MTNNYQMAYRDQTTGWNPLFNNVNERNKFGMLPAEVALQAGDAKEFCEITSHPDFKNESLGRVNEFLAICRFESETAYQTIHNCLLDRFHFDKTINLFVKIQ